MTEVAFHFNAPDKLAYACRFARKVQQRSDARLVIAAPAPALAQLDAMLWALAPTDFVAHCREDADDDVLQASAVVLSAGAAGGARGDVLLNLHAEISEGFERFAKVVEVVSAHDESDREAARGRWREYTARGYTITRHDLVLKAG